MDIQELRREAQTMQPQLTADRRRLHRNLEAGAVLPETVAYVKGRLTEMGYHPQELGGGLTATVTGTDTGRCILLRADMDALRGQEQSGLSFRSENGCMHACGHDMHTAMLLGAARLLMQHRQELSGTVKLVFQPDEEGFTGAKAMLAAGVLQAPVPSEALALHVHSGTPLRNGAVRQRDLHGGLYPVPHHGAGKGLPRGHAGDGRGPHRHRRPDLAGPAGDHRPGAPAKTPAVVTVGRFQAGQAPNIIPDEAVLEGTVRTFDRAVTARIMERIRQLSEGIASAFRGSAQMEELASAPPLQNDPALTEDMAALAETLLGREKVYRLKEGGMGSEDFASYTYELPCAYLLLGAGSPQEDPATVSPCTIRRWCSTRTFCPWAQRC